MKKQKIKAERPNAPRGGPAKPASKNTSRRRQTPSIPAPQDTRVRFEAALAPAELPTAELPTPQLAVVDSTSNGPPSEQRQKERQEEATPPSEPVSSVRKIDAAAAAKYQRVYAAARITGRDGLIQLDEQRFAQSLAALVVDPLTEQDLYSLALMAAADGDASLFKEDVVMELRAG